VRVSRLSRTVIKGDGIAVRTGHALAQVAVVLAIAGCASRADVASTCCSPGTPASAGRIAHFGDLELVPDHLSAHVVEAVREHVSRALWPRTDFSRHLVPLYDFLPGGPPPDGIPPLNHPRVVPAASADRYLRADEPVLAVALGGQARAYPIRIMLWHEIANDILDGRPIAVTYCPLCNSGEVFDRRAGGRVLRFGTSGLAGPTS
jgi:hypothetical protein